MVLLLPIGNIGRAHLIYSVKYHYTKILYQALQKAKVNAIVIVKKGVAWLEEE